MSSTPSPSNITVQPRPAPESSESKRRKRLASYTVRNMVWSVLAVLGIVLAWWSITFNPQESQRRAPEVTQTATYVAQEADWPVWVPELGEGWTPTVVWFDPIEDVQTWHVSYTSPQGRYVALHQAADVTPEWMATVLKGADEVGTVDLGGPAGEQSWTQWRGAPDSNAEHGYVLGPEQTGGTTVALHGTATQEEFEAFLAALEAKD